MSARVLLAASALMITASGCGGDPAAPSLPAAGRSRTRGRVGHLDHSSGSDE